MYLHLIILFIYIYKYKTQILMVTFEDENASQLVLRGIIAHRGKK